MASFQNVQVAGLDELHRALKVLPDNIARNALRGSVRAGAGVIQKEAKRRAPKDTGRLRKAIFNKQIREKSSLYQQTHYVGVLMGKKYQEAKKTRMVNGQKVETTQDLDAYYGFFLEYGSSKMAARPFMRPAWETQKDAALQAITDYLSKRMDAEAQKSR